MTPAETSAVDLSYIRERPDHCHHEVTRDHELHTGYGSPPSKTPPLEGGGGPVSALTFVRRAAERRAELDVSQNEIARRMRTAGFDWHQTTVSRTEAGERPIRLDEAVALAEALDMNINDLTHDVELRRAHERIAELERRIATASKALGGDQ